MFGFGRPHFLGVDFGTSYIKAVELELRNNIPTLVNYGYIEMNLTEGKDAFFSVGSSEQMVQDHLKELLLNFKPVSKTVNLAIPGSSGLIKLIELPEMSRTELEQAIPFEARKYIPSPLEEVAFSWEVVPSAKQDTSQQKKIEVLLVAALRKEVAKFERYVSGSGLSVDLLELEVFPLVRSVIRDISESVLVIDIGSRETNLIVVRDGVVCLNRSINSGGNEITSILSESFHVSWERAEELKRSTKDFLNQPESALSFSVFDVISSEVSRILSAYSEKSSGSVVVERILLSGGTAKMRGLSDFFSRTFNLPVSTADPWQGIQVNEIVRPALNRFGPSFSIAIGLALGGIDRYRKK